MLEGKKVFVAGHRGMVGSALCRVLQGEKDLELLTATRSELDLRQQDATQDFFTKHKPDVVIVAAATVGGIHANNAYPAEFAYDNLAIAINTVHSAHETSVERLLFLGSSCIYPKFAEQPIREDSLLTGLLEPTNEAYAVAKIAGLKLCEYYRMQYGDMFHSAMPCNLYGLGDNYHPDNSHVIPGMIRRFHEAKVSGSDSVEIWGTGNPKREFLFADDLARGCIHLLGVENPPSIVNLGAGEDISIKDLAKRVAKVTGFPGKIENDLSKLDGTPRKLLDSTTAKSLGWVPETSLEEGLEKAYEDFLNQHASATR